MGRRAIFLAGALSWAAATATPHAARAAKVYAELSDFEVFANEVPNGGPDIPYFRAGDLGGSMANLGTRGVFKFETNQMFGRTVTSAVLHLTLLETRKDHNGVTGTSSTTAPFVNPGLGDLVIVQTTEYFYPDVDDYHELSHGNDPGVLVPAGIDPTSNQLEINILPAVVQTVIEHRFNVVLRLQTTVESDGDGLADWWSFGAKDNVNMALWPTLEYTLLETLTANFNGDGNVGAADLTAWINAFGTLDDSPADADGDGDSDGADLLAWQTQLGSVEVGATAATGAIPEPTGVAIAAVGLLGTALRRRSERTF